MNHLFAVTRLICIMFFFFYLCMSISHQLIMMKQKEATLQKFEEGSLDFQPTYKFDLHSDNYDTR